MTPTHTLLSKFNEYVVFDRLHRAIKKENKPCFQRTQMIHTRHINVHNQNQLITFECC